MTASRLPVQLSEEDLLHQLGELGLLRDVLPGPGWQQLERLGRWVDLRWLDTPPSGYEPNGREPLLPFFTHREVAVQLGRVRMGGLFHDAKRQRVHGRPLGWPDD